MAEVLLLVHVIKNALPVDMLSSFDWRRIRIEGLGITELWCSCGRQFGKTTGEDDVKNLVKERGTKMLELKIRVGGYRAGKEMNEQSGCHLVHSGPSVGPRKGQNLSHETKCPLFFANSKTVFRDQRHMMWPSEDLDAFEPCLASAWPSRVEARKYFEPWCLVTVTINR